MATPEFIWPTHQFTPKTQKWQLRGAAKSGGASIGGVVQATRVDGGGYWLLELGEIKLMSADQLRAWRAWEMIVDNGATPVVFKMCDPRQRPDVIVGGVLAKAHFVTHSDGMKFSDGSTYASVPINAFIATAAPLRATTIEVDIDNVALRGGEHFSIDHPAYSHRLYRVRTVEHIDGARHRITFRPPLREAVAPGERVDFNNPSCVMRIIDGDQMPIEIEDFRRATARAIFVEHFG